jgi:hypothetical protein
MFDVEVFIAVLQLGFEDRRQGMCRRALSHESDVKLREASVKVRQNRRRAAFMGTVSRSIRGGQELRMQATAPLAGA